MLRAALILCTLAEAASADLEITIRDGDPWDRITIRNLAACGAVEGRLRIDLTSSEGDLLIDTVRGGPGTKDPMPVEVLNGPARVAPVEDGAQEIEIWLAGLGAGQSATIGLDFDDQASWWPGPRVVVFGEEIAGSAAQWQILGGGARAVFGTSGRARLAAPVEADCTHEAPAEGAEPETAPVG